MKQTLLTDPRGTPQCSTRTSASQHDITNTHKKGENTQKELAERNHSRPIRYTAPTKRKDKKKTEVTDAVYPRHRSPMTHGPILLPENWCPTGPSSGIFCWGRPIVRPYAVRPSELYGHQNSPTKRKL